MSYRTYVPSTTYSAPSAPHAFSLLATAQSPRDTYHMYEGARQVRRPSNGRTNVSKTKTSGLKKIFGL
ncbi:hypothetical protein C8Q77DRAFT_1051622 [Trametes polyzona]|nr:hypothetical protein C8Q77DRAFT_1051622 [Trametes polyzona]